MKEGCLFTSCIRVIAGPNVSCELNGSNYFLIHCPKDDDTSLSIFSEILGKFIKTKIEKELDMFEVRH